VTVLPYAASVAASALYFRVSILLVSVLSGAKELGYFGASYRMIEVATLVPGLLVSSAFPIFSRAARDDHERLGYAIGKVYEVGLLVGTWVAVSIVVGASLAVSVIGGPAFKPAVPVLQIQGIALGVMFVSAVFASGLLSLGVYRQILLLSLAGLLATALLVAGLVLLDGARGAAIGTAIGETVGVLAQAAVLLHGRPQLRLSLRILPRVALAALMGLAPLLLPGVPVVARLAISTTLFAAVAIGLRTLPAELGALAPGSAIWARVVGR
jgi:O-antigen/teichoic acid export membrane protein